MVKNDKCMGVSQLLGARVRAASPKSIPMLNNIFTYFISREVPWPALGRSSLYSPVLGHGP